MLHYISYFAWADQRDKVGRDFIIFVPQHIPEGDNCILHTRAIAMNVYVHALYSNSSCSIFAYIVHTNLLPKNYRKCKHTYIT